MRLSGGDTKATTPELTRRLYIDLLGRLPTKEEMDKACVKRVRRS